MVATETAVDPGHPVPNGAEASSAIGVRQIASPSAPFLPIFSLLTFFRARLVTQTHSIDVSPWEANVCASKLDVQIGGSVPGLV